MNNVQVIFIAGMEVILPYSYIKITQREGLGNRYKGTNSKWAMSAVHFIE